MLVRSNICNLIYHISDNWLIYSVSVSVTIKISLINREEFCYALSAIQWPSVKTGGEVRRKQTKCTFRPPSVDQALRHLKSKNLSGFQKREVSHSLSSSLHFKEKYLRLYFWAIQNGEKIVTHKVLWVEKQFLPSCINPETRRSWILFLWLHTGVHTGRSSDPGGGTYTFHSNIQLRRPLDVTVWYVCHSHAAYRTYGQVKVRIVASWDYANNSLFVSINKTNAELCAIDVREIHLH